MFFESKYLTFESLQEWMQNLTSLAWVMFTWHLRQGKGFYAECQCQVTFFKS